MHASRKFAPALLALVTLTALASTARGADPGLPFPAPFSANDQRVGSVLIYTVYTSSATAPETANTRINITNTSTTSAAFVHLFFVDGSTCSVADSFICLTTNQTASFLTSELDPGVTGYVVAIAVDGATGCPLSFNFLFGDEFVKFATGHAASLGAEAIPALFTGILPGCTGFSTTARLPFDGTIFGLFYDEGATCVEADTAKIMGIFYLDCIGGDLTTRVNRLGSVFGILYDDAENAHSFTFFSDTCQFRGELSNSFPRTTPRFEQVVPPGRTGWMRILRPAASNNCDGCGLVGAVFIKNDDAEIAAEAFNGGRNLHKLTPAPGVCLTVPIIPPSC